MNLKNLMLLPLALAVAVPAAFATPIPISPGVPITSFSPSTSSFSGTLVPGDAISAAFSNSSESGTVFEDVYRSNGVLDFYYKVVNNSSSSDYLVTLAVSNFQGYSPAVDYLTNGSVAPNEAFMLPSGTINYDFYLAPGQSTDWMEVATDATATMPSLDTVADNQSSNLNLIGPAPEPLSLGLLSTGLLAIGVARWRRSGKKA